MYTPIEPDVGGVDPFDPLKLRPVPSGLRDDESVKYSSPLSWAYVDRTWSFPV